VNEHHYQRIDKGLERKPSQLENEVREQARNEKGVFLPICSTEKRSEIILEALECLQHGESTQSIAERHGLKARTLRSWLIALPEADHARAIMVANELSNSLQEIEEADGPMPLARAREAFRGWAWIGERRLPQYFGPKQEIVHFNVDLGDRLRRARERVIDQAPIDNQPNTGVMSNPQEAQTIQALPEPKDPDQKK
jgi:transposase-like protein